MNITLNPLRKAPDSLQCPGGEGPKRPSFFQRAVALVLCAALFGGVAGGSFYGVNRLLGSLEPDSSDSGSSLTSSVSLTSLSHSSGDSSLDIIDIAAQGLTSVVSVTNISLQEVQNYFGQFGRNGRGEIRLQETTSCGSGVIIGSDDSQLYMVTNYHVAEGATQLSVTFADDQTYAAQLLGYDSSVDIALLGVPLNSITSDTLSQISIATIGDSDDLMIGEQVVAIGNALGYGQSVTTGIISALDRTISSDSGTTAYIQTDAAINPGNSGGALLNMEGELIGINTAKVSSTDVEGMGYAIPISQVLEVISNLMN